MEKFYSFIIVLTLFVSGVYVYREVTKMPCESTIKYSIGRFDTSFGITLEDFKKNLVEAEKPWEAATSKNLFQYDPNAKFKVNLIYDDRQKTTSIKQKTEYGLSAAEDDFRAIDRQFEDFNSKYKNLSAQYESDVADFEKRSRSYESKVQSFNKRGGAPNSVYNELEAERQVLNAESTRLNNVALDLNTMSLQLKALLAKRNMAAENYNSMITGYEKKYGTGIEFNQAEHMGDVINVYQFANNTDLVQALAHEFGHALGMNHVQNKDSIMYYETESDEIKEPIITTEDLVELKRVCQ